MKTKPNQTLKVKKSKWPSYRGGKVNRGQIHVPKNKLADHDKIFDRLTAFAEDQIDQKDYPYVPWHTIVRFLQYELSSAVEQAREESTVRNAAQFSNFAQKFKMLIWDKWDGGAVTVNEKMLDDIALELWEYLKPTKAKR